MEGSRQIATVVIPTTGVMKDPMRVAQRQIDEMHGSWKT
jgi:hypothetical protein